MNPRRRFEETTLSAIREGKILRMRAGTRPHRFIGIWAVVVEGRVFVRSWSQKPRSWYRTFLEEPRGVVQVEGREVPVRAVRTRSERLKQAIDRAYLDKYDTPGSIKYARDLGRAASRATTTELVPRRSPAAAGPARRPSEAARGRARAGRARRTGAGRRLGAGRREARSGRPALRGS